MPGVLLSGPIGVGKTHTQQRLIAEYGFWSPTEWTTRQVRERRDTRRYISEQSFISSVRNGSFVLPARFAGYWYAWEANDLWRLSTDRDMAALDVRPYTALCLSALVPNLHAVWLWISPGELRARRATRQEQRDLDSSMRQAREDQDQNDQVYETLFKNRVEADVNAVSKIIEIVGIQW